MFRIEFISGFEVVWKATFVVGAKDDVRMDVKMWGEDVVEII